MMKSIRNIYLSAVVITVAGMLTGCASSELPDSLPDNYVVNMVIPEQQIQLTGEQQAFAVANNQFAFNFFNRINAIDGTKSSFCSPISVSYLLGMLQSGATGETRQQIQRVLGMATEEPTAINGYFAKLMDEMQTLDPQVTLNIANSIFVNKDKATTKQAFAADMERYYQATIDNLDFSNPSSVNIINDWCNDKTKGMIPKIIDEIGKNAVMYLLNAIYFKADWTEKFEEKYTRNETFRTITGKSKEIPMMHQRVRARFGECPDYTSIYLPYGKGAFTMTIVLPNEGKTIDDILPRIGYDHLLPKFCGVGETYQEGICDVDVKIPRFETATEMEELPDILSEMGMPLAFNSEFAEFTGMVNEGTLYVDKMKQKAKIEVNEEGSKAAAVTIAEMGFATAVGPSQNTVYEKRDFHANRPFVYLIKERGSGIVLFIGKYTGE